jgi:hypothetical protein
MGALKIFRGASISLGQSKLTCKPITLSIQNPLLILGPLYRFRRCSHNASAGQSQINLEHLQGCLLSDHTLNFLTSKFGYLHFCPTPPIKLLKLGLQIGGRVLIAKHLDRCLCSYFLNQTSCENNVFEELKIRCLWNVKNLA